jgi:hypothetical protein
VERVPSLADVHPRHVGGLVGEVGVVLLRVEGPEGVEVLEHELDDPLASFHDFDLGTPGDDNASRELTPLTPARLLDTRIGTGGRGRSARHATPDGLEPELHAGEDGAQPRHREGRCRRARHPRQRRRRDARGGRPVRFLHERQRVEHEHHRPDGITATLRAG